MEREKPWILPGISYVTNLNSSATPVDLDSIPKGMYIPHIPLYIHYPIIISSIIFQKKNIIPKILVIYSFLARKTIKD